MSRLAYIWQLKIIFFGVLLCGDYLEARVSYICKCEDSDVRDRPFVAIWNAPTGGCSVNYSIDINLRDFGILENPKQTWDGKYVTVFYNAQLGLYPYFTDPEGTNSYNGGMPQLIDIAAHLNKMTKDIVKKIPDPEYSGLAVIDWEGWRPTWDRNFDSKRIYQSRSVDIVQEKYPEWSMEEQIQEAKKEFERSARIFMESSIKLARDLRPKGLWGFYGFPDCFGSSETNYRCSNEHKLLNDNIKWLFSSSTALYPSLYMYDQQSWNKEFAYGRLEESFRLTNAVLHEKNRTLPVFPYFRHLYEGKPLEFAYLTKVDLRNTIGQAADMGAAGVVIWGNRRDENTSPKVCQELNDYVRTRLGPYVESVCHRLETCSVRKCSGHGRCVNRKLILSKWMRDKPHLYSEKCIGPTKTFDSHKKPFTRFEQKDQQEKNHNSDQTYLTHKTFPAREPFQKHGLNPKQRQFLMKELKLLNSSNSKTVFLKSHRKNSSEDFVVFMSTSGSDVEVNKAPKEIKGGGTVASSGLHYEDQLTKSPNFRETLAKGAVASDRLVLCNGSSTGSSDCEIMKESPATFSRTFHFPHTYVVFLCVSLGSALLVSSAFIMSYYFFNVRKRTDKAEEDDGPSGD